MLQFSGSCAHIWDHFTFTHFCQRLSRAQDHTAAGRTNSIINSSGTIGNRTRHLPAFSAVHQPAALSPRSSVIWFLHIQILSDINGASTGKSLPTFRNADNSSPIDTASHTRRPDPLASPVRYPYLFPCFIIISNLSNDRSKASSKTIPPHSAI